MILEKRGLLVKDSLEGRLEERRTLLEPEFKKSVSWKRISLLIRNLSEFLSLFEVSPNLASS